MNTDSGFLIRNKQQIINHLIFLLKQKCLFNLYFGENESFITTLLEIDPSKGRIILDYGPKDYLNKKLLNATHIGFRTTFSGIKVAFEGSDIEPATHDGQAAFSMPIPEDLLWCQRRQFYRVKSPLSKTSHLSLAIEDRSSVNLPLYDISISGFSILNESSELANLLMIDQEFKDCQLVLENTAADSISFKIQNTIALNPKKPDKTQKIGCKFTAISPAFESSIQRYMQQIERENKLKS